MKMYKKIFSMTYNEFQVAGAFTVKLERKIVHLEIIRLKQKRHLKLE